MSAGTDTPTVAQLLSFAQRQRRTNPRYQHPLDRRGQQRISHIVPAVIQPVAFGLRALGDPLDVVTRDFSSAGVGVITGLPLAHNLYSIRFEVEQEPRLLLGLRVWTEPRGPFYFIGFDVVRTLESE